MMKLIHLFYIVCFIGLHEIGYAQTFDYQRGWATYFGDEGIDLADSAMDTEGNMYLVGRVRSGSVFNATANAYQTAYGGGVADGFLTKISPVGEILWSTFIGGESVDYITGITIDGYNVIYIIGSTGSANSMATSNAWQTTLEGSTDTFINKFDASGAKIWGTYYPSADSDPESMGGTIRNSGPSIVADKQAGGIYFFNRTNNANLATSGAFQATIGQDYNNVITKFSVDGLPIWATYYGINFSQMYSITLGSDGLYVAGDTSDCLPIHPENTYFATMNAHQPVPGSCRDIFITKFSFAGQRLWSTYYGNTNNAYTNKNGLLVSGNALYVTGTTISSPNITTIDSYQEDSGSNYTAFLVKFNTEGIRLWGTYYGLDYDIYGNSLVSSSSSLAGDSQGNIYLTAATKFQDNIASTGAYQENKSGGTDLFVAQFNPDGDVNWGTYYGSSENEYASKSLVYNDVFYLLGETASATGITTPNSLQPGFIDNGNSSDGLIKNIFIVRFEPLPLSVESFAASSFEVYPNPNQGSFNIKNPNNEPYTVQIYNMLGQLVLETCKKQNSVERIDTLNLSSGSYLLNITTASNATYTQKMLITN
ncbi:T9SS type A sorting domain-containing protein [Bizionia sediminis]|uniref:T9SS type A sorting domain-containing protein n=1 Tax=Bizionia sediminis TaxID=1737064 RepID=A0ABW5KUJ9_9FLAO